MYKTVPEALEVILKADPNRTYEVIDLLNCDEFEGSAADVLEDLYCNWLDGDSEPVPKDEQDEECCALLEYFEILTSPHDADYFEMSELYRKVKALIPVPKDQ